MTKASATASVSGIWELGMNIVTATTAKAGGRRASIAAVMRCDGPSAGPALSGSYHGNRAQRPA